MPPKVKPASKSTTSTTTTKKTSPSKSSPVKTSTAKKTVPAKTGVKKTGAAKKTVAPVKTPAKTVPEIEKKDVVISVTEVAFKDVAKVLLDTSAGEKDDGRCSLVIDPSGNVSTFLKYREVNLIDAVDPTQLQPEVIRKALLGAIRYGKVLAVDMKDTDMFDTCTEKFDEVYKGLMEDVLSRDIINKYKLIVKDTDGDEYKKAYDFCDDLMKNFKFVIITKIEPNAELMKKTNPIRVI